MDLLNMSLIRSKVWGKQNTFPCYGSPDISEPAFCSKIKQVGQTEKSQIKHCTSPFRPS